MPGSRWARPLLVMASPTHKCAPQECATVVLEAGIGTPREALMRERERADQAEAAEREREDGRVRAVAAEGKGLREALAEARRPFWRRRIGS